MDEIAAVPLVNPAPTAVKLSSLSTSTLDENPEKIMFEFALVLTPGGKLQLRADAQAAAQTRKAAVAKAEKRTGAREGTAITILLGDQPAESTPVRALCSERFTLANPMFATLDVRSKPNKTVSVAAKIDDTPNALVGVNTMLDHLFRSLSKH